MNPVIEALVKRKSIRAYEQKEIDAQVRAEMLKATLRAPTAGNMMLYSIVEVTDQEMKDKLAITCDHQPFIAKAPMLWLFLADYQRWFDYFVASDVEALCRQKKIDMRRRRRETCSWRVVMRWSPRRMRSSRRNRLGSGPATSVTSWSSTRLTGNYSTCRNTPSPFACCALVSHRTTKASKIHNALRPEIHRF